MKQLIYIFFVCTLFSACTSISDKEVDTSDIDVNVKIQRLEQELFSLQSKESVKAFLDKYPVLTEYFLPFAEGIPDSSKVTKIYELIQNEGLRQLYQDSERTFGNMNNIQSQFTEAFKHIKYYYPDFKVPVIQTIVTGFGRDLLVSDSLIIIGLDYFIGDSASYRPDAPLYVLRTFRKEYIVPKIVLLISQPYNQIKPQDKSLLSDMIYYGKSYEFTSHILPDTPDSLIIGYTGEQLKESDENRNVIWAHFIEKKLLYETSHFVKIKYVEDRPYTAEIGSKAPGAIGRWLGWEIVKAYRKEESTSLQDLMKNQDAQRIFMQSKYKGKG